MFLILLYIEGGGWREGSNLTPGNHHPMMTICPPALQQMLIPHCQCQSDVTDRPSETASNKTRHTQIFNFCCRNMPRSVIMVTQVCTCSTDVSKSSFFISASRCVENPYIT